jgi:predicted enzyme related to lactoylglutathione lyase
MSENHAHHAIDYLEITVTDVAEAKRFYGAAFDWQFNDYGPEYAGIKGEGREVGGFRQDATVRAGGPLVILYSKNLEDSVAKVRAAGGKILQPPYEFPGGRRFHFSDPAGNELAVWGA